MIPGGARQINFAYKPEPMQVVYLSCPAQEVMYGGAAGGMKTDSQIVRAITRCLTYPQLRQVIFRRTFPQLAEILSRTFQLIPRQLGRYHVADHAWRFHNGSTLQLSHLERDASVHNHQGQSYGGIYWDEGTHFTQYQLEYLSSRLRIAGRPDVPLDWSIASNPGGVGHAYLLSEYVEPQVTGVKLLAYYSKKQQQWVRFPEGTTGTPGPFVVWEVPINDVIRGINREREQDGMGELPPITRCFIPSRVQDNPYLANDGRYMTRLASLAPGERAALLDGNWHIFEGQAFPEFRQETHVIEPIRPPAHWQVWGSLDWGYTAPLAMHWHTIVPESGKVITFDEVYMPKLNDADVVEYAKLKSNHPGPMLFHADPALFHKDSSGSGLSKADIYQQLGMAVEPANNTRLVGKARIHELMAVDPETGEPGWQVTRNCKHLIRTLPGLVYDDKKKEDVNTTGEDHAYDSLRYGLMAAPTNAIGAWGEIEAGYVVVR